VLTERDIADQLVELLDPSEQDNAGFNSVEYLLSTLSSSPVGPLLFVLDNFETVRSPSDLYASLDAYIRNPNKILITTRLRDFKADFPVEVGGMRESEFSELVRTTANRLAIQELITEQYEHELYLESDGHPYVAKVMLGEVATAKRLTRVQRVMAAREDILDALFERTYAQLPPVAQRVFLTMCNWRSSIPRLALEAALLRPENDRMDVDDGVEILRRMSLVDSTTSPEDGQEILAVPLAAALFGKRKLSVSPIRSAVDADTELLRLLGAARPTDSRGIAPRIERLFREVAKSVEAGRDLDGYLPVLEFVASGYPPAWLLLADLLLEQRDSRRHESGEAALRRYLEQVPTDWSVWVRLAFLCDQRGAYDAELSAYVQATRQPAVPFRVVSNAANRANLLIYDGRLARTADASERQIILTDLATELARRIGEGDGSDYSRLAWLYVNLEDYASARTWTQRGLKVDRDNVHLNKLARKRDIRW
jgi:hypothetical protein